MASATPGRNGFGSALRLHGQRAFGAVYAARVRKHVGPLTIYARPNDLPHSRLGLSVSRAVGSAVVRNRIKRLVREAFRLGRHDWPGGYDLVVVVRRHEPMKLTDYQRLLETATRGLARLWERKGRRDGKDG